MWARARNRSTPCAACTCPSRGAAATLPIPIAARTPSPAPHPIPPCSAAMAVLRQQAAFVDELHGSGIVDDAERRAMQARGAGRPSPRRAAAWLADGGTRWLRCRGPGQRRALSGAASTHPPTHPPTLVEAGAHRAPRAPAGDPWPRVARALGCGCLANMAPSLRALVGALPAAGAPHGRRRCLHISRPPSSKRLPLRTPRASPAVREVLRGLPFLAHLPEPLFDALLERGQLLGALWWGRAGNALEVLRAACSCPAAAHCGWPTRARLPSAGGAWSWRGAGARSPAAAPTPSQPPCRPRQSSPAESSSTGRRRAAAAAAGRWPAGTSSWSSTALSATVSRVGCHTWFRAWSKGLQAKRGAPALPRRAAASAAGTSHACSLRNIRASHPARFSAPAQTVEALGGSTFWAAAACWACWGR